MKRATKEPPLPQDAILDVSTLAIEFFRGKERAVRKGIERRTIPFRYRGKRIIFLRHEVEEFFKKLPGCSIHEALVNVAARGGDEKADT